MESNKIASEADSAGNITEEIKVPLGTEEIKVPLGTEEIKVPLGTEEIKVPLGTEEIIVPLGNRRESTTDSEKTTPQQLLDDYRGLSTYIPGSPQSDSEPPAPATTPQPSTSGACPITQKNDTEDQFLTLRKDLKANFENMVDISACLAHKMDTVAEDFKELNKKVEAQQKSNQVSKKKLEVEVELLKTKVDTLQIEIQQLGEDVTGFKTSFANIEAILKTIDGKNETPGQPNLPGPSGSAQLERQPVPAPSLSVSKRKENEEEANEGPATKLIKMTKGDDDDDDVAGPSTKPPVENPPNSQRSKGNRKSQPQQEGPNGPMTRRRSQQAAKSNQISTRSKTRK